MLPYHLSKSALRDMERLPLDIRRMIFSKLDYYTDEGGSYRFRIGSYRAVFDVRQRSIIILRIGHRRDIYK